MKIKKYTLFILILIALIGIFIPIAQVNALSFNDCVYETLDAQTGETADWDAAEAACAYLNDASVTACADLTGVGGIICKLHQILASIIPVLVALGLLYFVWGVVQYVIGDDEEAKKRGKDHIIYGIIGFAVIVGLWGLVNVVVNTFGLAGSSIPALATPGEGGCDLDTIAKPKLQDLLEYGTCIIYKSVVPLIFALALAMFIWGVVQFVLNSSEEAKKEQGRQFMLWGIIALTVMFSIWGLVSILGDTFGIDSTFFPKVKE